MWWLTCVWLKTPQDEKKMTDLVVRLRAWTDAKVDVVFESGVDIKFMSALRRTITEDLATLCFDRMHVLQNGSTRDDEQIQQNLQFTHLKRPARPLTLPKRCECGEKGCDKCQIMVEFKAKVAAGDIAQTVNAGAACVADPQRLLSNPTCAYTCLTILGSGRDLHVRAFARVLFGRQHASGMAAACATFLFTPNIRLHRKLQETTQKTKTTIVSSCPRKVLDLSAQGVVSVRRPDLCTFCNRCVHIAEEHKLHDCIVITPRERAGRFFIDSKGGVPAPVLLADGIEALRLRLEALRVSLRQAFVRLST